MRLSEVQINTGQATRHLLKYRCDVDHLRFVYGPFDNSFYSQIKQDRQCSYNIILWRVRVTTVAMEKQECVLLVLLRYMSLQTRKNISYCTTTLSWQINVWQQRNILRPSCKLTDIFVRL
jgi:hypothetical protein